MNNRHLKAKSLHNTTILFLLSTPLVVLSYGLFIYNPSNADNVIMYLLLLIADSIGIFAVMGLWLTILLDVLVPDHHQHKPKHYDEFMQSPHSVDVLITVAGEPVEIVRKTVVAAKKMKYPHKTFILDDGKSLDVKSLAMQLDVGYITREGSHFAKAGNLNNGLGETESEYVVVLDADQIPRRDFLNQLLPYMADKKMSMVQAPQHFVNTDNFIAEGTTEAQEIFYKYICPARNQSNSVFCVGTNVLFRREALDEIGGIAEISHSEDIWTSIRLHERGWKTIFVSEILTQGLAPDTITAYFRQQHRWAKGGLSMLFAKNPLSSKELSLDQRMHYFLSNSFYLVGFSMLMYAVFPIMYLLFDLKPLDTEDGLLWLVHYLPYLFMYYSLSWLLLGKLSLSNIAVSFASFYPYILATLSVLFDTSSNWVATAAKGGSNKPLMAWVWPHILIMILTIFALIVGWSNPMNFWSTLFYSVLAVWNFYLFFVFLTSSKRANSKAKQSNNNLALNI